MHIADLLFQSIRSELQANKKCTRFFKVTPKSSKNEVIDQMANGVWKVKIKAVPEKGKANTALISFFAKELKLPKNNITIESGETSHHKRLTFFL